MRMVGGCQGEGQVRILHVGNGRWPVIVIDDLLHEDQFQAAATESLQANYVASSGTVHAYRRNS